MLPPERHHQGSHSGDFFSCKRCETEQRICRRKLEFLSTADAHQYMDLNAFGKAQYWYGCRWCRNYHISTAKTTREKRIAAEQQHKWNIAKRNR